MNQNSIQKRDLISIGKASEYLGVSIDTLRRWEKKGRTEPLRSPGGHRYFQKEQLDKLFGKKYIRDKETKIEKTKEELKKIKKTERSTKAEVSQETENKKLIILDRPVREFNIPEVKPVRIIQEKPILAPFEAYVMQQNASVLTPPSIDTPAPSPVKNVAKISNLDKTKTLVLVLLFLFFLLNLFFIVLWRSSQSILSPVP